MSYKLPALKLALSLTLLSAIPAFALTAEAESDAPSTAPVAYVYAQTAEGVNVYDAAADGQLTLVKGSPFKAVGRLVGSNGRYLFTWNYYSVRGYSVEASGAIGKQVSEINALDYDGSYCGGRIGAVDVKLDHTGQSLYVTFLTPWLCDSIQTFNIDKESGDLTYIGATQTGHGTGDGLSKSPSILENDKFAYTVGNFGYGNTNPSLFAFKRESDGRMVNWTFNKSLMYIGPDRYTPSVVTADPTNHLAALVRFNPSPGVWDHPQLASYSVDNEGNVSTTNTAEEMPYANLYANFLEMSTSGKFLAVGLTNGFQIYHFNGSVPITIFSAPIIPAVEIDQIHWDQNDHLYGLSIPTNRLYVYTVTPTTISETPGSPYTLPAECAPTSKSENCSWGLAVVPKP